MTEPVAATPLRADATGASAPSLVQTSGSGTSPRVRGCHPSLRADSRRRQRPADHRARVTAACIGLAAPSSLFALVSR